MRWQQRCAAPLPCSVAREIAQLSRGAETLFPACVIFLAFASGFPGQAPAGEVWRTSPSRGVPVYRAHPPPAQGAAATREGGHGERLGGRAREGAERGKGAHSGLCRECCSAREEGPWVARRSQGRRRNQVGSGVLCSHTCPQHPAGWRNEVESGGRVAQKSTSCSESSHKILSQEIFSNSGGAR